MPKKTYTVDYKSNPHIQEKSQQYKERQLKAKLDSNVVLEEKHSLVEKRAQLNIVKNRVAYLQKKIEEVNGQIHKQDHLIDKIKDNQER